MNSQKSQKSTMSHADTMRLPMNSQKSHLVEPRFHLTSSQEISINLPSTSGRQKGSTVCRSTPQPRQKPHQPRLRSCRWKARPYQPIPSLTGALRTSTVSFEGSSPWKRSRLDGSLVGPRPLSYMVMTRSFINVTLRASYSAISQSEKARTYSRTYTRGLAVTTQRPEPSLETHSDRVSIGQPRSPTLSS
jgi:hypothetical protein